MVHRRPVALRRAVRRPTSDMSRACTWLSGPVAFGSLHISSEAAAGALASSQETPNYDQESPRTPKQDPPGYGAGLAAISASELGRAPTAGISDTETEDHRSGASPAAPVSVVSRERQKLCRRRSAQWRRLRPQSASRSSYWGSCRCKRIPSRQLG